MRWRRSWLSGWSCAAWSTTFCHRKAACNPLATRANLVVLAGANLASVKPASIGSAKLRGDLKVGEPAALVGEDAVNVPWCPIAGVDPLPPSSLASG